MVHLSYAWLSAALFWAASGAQAQTGTSHLTPAQIDKVQSLGRAVLSAKRSQTPDPALASANSQLEALRDAVDDLARASGLEVRPGRVLELESPVTAEARPRGADAGRARDTLRALRQARRAASSEQATAGSSGKSEAAAARLREWAEEAEAALAAPDAERVARLRGLRDKLRADRPAPESRLVRQPTLSTLVRHRE